MHANINKPWQIEMKNKLLSLCFLILFGAVLPESGLMAQVLQTGIVKEYRGADEKVPLAGVEINVYNAPRTLSGQDGTFSLQFRSLHAGDLVNVRSILKQGYEIFNKEALEQWIISGRADIPFTIVMCPVAQFKRMRDNYERVSSANYEAQYKKEKARLAQKRDEGKMTQSQYEVAVQKANANYEQRRSQITLVAEKFSRIDLSELSASEREVINLVQRGELDRAIVTAEERGNMMHMADLYQLGGGVENMEKADSLLRRLAWSDTTQLAPMAQFAEFAYRQADWLSACRAYELCLRHVGNEPIMRAPLAHNLGLLYLRLNNQSRAQSLLTEALMGFEDLCLRDPEGWQASLTSTQLSLGALHLNSQRYDEALASFRSVVDTCNAIWSRDTTQNQILSQWVKAENNLGVVYMQQKKYSEAQKVLSSALMHAQKMQEREIPSAGICNSLGNLFLVTGHLPEAEKRYKMSERLLLPQMARNPQGAMPDLARCYYNLYRICSEQPGREAEAKRYLDTAIRQYEILATNQPQTYRKTLTCLKSLRK